MNDIGQNVTEAGHVIGRIAEVQGELVQGDAQITHSEMLDGEVDLISPAEAD